MSRRSAKVVGSLLIVAGLAPSAVLLWLTWRASAGGFP
jgi:hypothetical protein